MRTNYFNIAKKIIARGNLKWLIIQIIHYINIKLVEKYFALPLAGPVMASIITTYRCNHHCAMCNIKEKQSHAKEFDTQAMLDLIKQFCDLGTTGIAFTGGEPLLRSDIGILIKYAKNSGMIVNLSTNGYLLTEETIADNLLEACPDNINISLLGATSDLHDRLSGCRGGFDKVIKGIKQLIYKRNREKSPLMVTIVTVLRKDNIDEVEDIYSLAHNLGIDSIGFIPLHIFREKYFSLADDNFLKKLSSAIEFLIFKKKTGGTPAVENSIAYLKMFRKAFTGEKSPLRCISAYASCYVDVYGNVYGCWPHVVENKLITNVSGTNLADIWTSESYTKHRIIMRECRDCFWNCHSELSLLFNRVEE